MSTIGHVNTKKVTVTLLCRVFFYFHNFEYQGSINVSVKFITKISNGSGEKVDFDGFAIFSNGGHLGFLT